MLNTRYLMHPNKVHTQNHSIHDYPNHEGMCVCLDKDWTSDDMDGF